MEISTGFKINNKKIKLGKKKNIVTVDSRRKGVDLRAEQSKLFI